MPFQGCSGFSVRRLFLKDDSVPGSRSRIPDEVIGSLSVGPDMESVIMELISSGVHL